jgi:ATP-dependent Clp protease ATP-binding subunit ClpB
VVTENEIAEIVSAWTGIPVYGARPLRRFIARELETRIGRALIANDVFGGATIGVKVQDGELVVTPDIQAPQPEMGDLA